MKHTLPSLVAVLVFLASAPLLKAADVWVDFSSFQTVLDLATTSAGVANFTPTERATIESNILADLNTVYSSYTIDFFTADPGGTREIINYGATTGGGSFGVAPLDFGNASAPGSTARVFTANFDTFIESFEPRAQQIAEISASLAGTGAHELGHALGARHHSAYGTLGITPANYASTTGLQNQHIMATGSTGLNESERETLRSLSPWTEVILDVAGGTSFGGIALTLSPVATDFESGDAGAIAAMAQSVALQTGETSGRQIGLVRGDLDAAGGGGADVDVYSFSAGVGTVTAELWSVDRFGSDFDGTLTLYDTDGTTVLFTNDDVRYNGDTFNSGTLREEDPFLLNIPIAAAGTYYLEVRAEIGGNPDFAANAGDDYILVWDAAIPEPSRGLLATLGLAAILLRRRR